MRRLNRCPARTNRVAISSNQHFVAHKIQTDHLRRHRRLIEIGPDRFFNIGPEPHQRVSLGVDAIARRRRVVATVGLVLADFKNDFDRIKRLYPNLIVRKSAYHTPTPRDRDRIAAELVVPASAGIQKTIGPAEAGTTNPSPVHAWP